MKTLSRVYSSLLNSFEKHAQKNCFWVTDWFYARPKSKRFREALIFGIPNVTSPPRGGPYVCTWNYGLHKKLEILIHKGRNLVHKRSEIANIDPHQ